MANETEWLTNFTVTQADIRRLEKWLIEEMRGVSLEELTRRIIRGRLRYGRDTSPSALPDWVQEKHVLSWDEIEKWCLGCQVLVAKTINDQIVPLFGMIVGLDEKYIEVQINDAVVTYQRVEPNSEAAKKFYKNIADNIWRREHQRADQPGVDYIDDQVDIALLKHGAQIASQIQGALERNTRFFNWDYRWYLKAWIQEISEESLRQIHIHLLRTTKVATLLEILEQNPELPKGEFGQVSLARALSGALDLFQLEEHGWRAIPPPPPPWPQAVGAYYVYDPDTYEILLEPNVPLKKKTAERIEALGWYADVVKPKDESATA